MEKIQKMYSISYSQTLLILDRNNNYVEETLLKIAILKEEYQKSLILFFCKPRSFFMGKFMKIN